MSSEVVRGLDSREVLLANCTSAARYAVLSREQQGYDTPYDHFLCDYIGEANAPLFPPVRITTPEGTPYDYNNGLMMQRSFTREGTLLNIRHAEGVVADGDENYEYFVATADLEIGETTAWRVLRTEKEALYGHTTVTLSLSRGCRVELIDSTDTPPEMASEKVEALVVLDSQRGVSFLNMAAGRGFEKLRGVAELITEVDELTGRLAIELDRRPQAGQQLARLIPLQRLSA